MEQRKPLTLADYRAKFDIFETVSFAKAWKDLHWGKVKEDLSAEDEAKALVYFNGVISGLSAIGQ